MFNFGRFGNATVAFDLRSKIAFHCRTRPRVLIGVGGKVQGRTPGRPLVVMAIRIKKETMLGIPHASGLKTCECRFPLESFG